LDDDPAGADSIRARLPTSAAKALDVSPQSAIERTNPDGVPILNNFVSAGHELRR
jgi:hypothetical protein